MAKTGYINGSDLLLEIGGKAVGHSTSHTLTLSSETKERSVKPLATASASAGKWKDKGISSLSISISAEGLRNFDETENGFAALLTAWKTAQSVEVKCYERGSQETPYLIGKFVITSLEETSPAEDDATYSIQLENDGEPTTLDGSVLTVSSGS